MAPGHASENALLSTSDLTQPENEWINEMTPDHNTVYGFFWWRPDRD